MTVSFYCVCYSLNNVEIRATACTNLMMKSNFVNQNSFRLGYFSNQLAL